jgi:serine/threonine-protein kinase RsbW
MSGSVKNIFTLKLKSIPKEILKIEKFLGDINLAIRFGEIQFHNLLVATTEAINNAIIHGNLRDPKKYVTIICKLTNTSLEIKVHDEGKGIEEEDLPDPLDEKNILKENGRGIFLMRHLMDSVKYKRDESGNEVTMKLRKQKKFD